MSLNFNNVKKKLEKEFEWLRQHYPINGFSEVELKIYDYNTYNKVHGDETEEEYDEKEVDAFVIDNIVEDDVQFAIFMIVNSEHVPDEVDKMVLAKGSVEEKDLFYFILYHEYGHLRQLHSTYSKSGKKELQREMEEMSDELEKLMNKREKEEINEEEFEKKYRELWFEEAADNFAYQIYQERKNEL